MTTAGACLGYLPRVRAHPAARLWGPNTALHRRPGAQPHLQAPRLSNSRQAGLACVYPSAMPAWFNAAWPVATFFLGGLSIHTRDLLAEKRQRKRDEETRRAERTKAIVDRREGFELDHLLRLNEALQTLTRAAAKIHHADLMVSRQTGQYASTLVGEPIGQELLEANRLVGGLKHLVLPDDLRALVQRAVEAVNTPSTMHRSNPAEAEQAFERGIVLVARAQEGIAERVRLIYLTAGEA